MSHNASNASDPPLRNFDDTNKTFSHDSIYWRIDWIVCEAIISILTVISIYIFISSLRYTLKKKNAPGRDIGGKQSKQLHITCTVAAGFAALRVISDHAVAFAGHTSDYACNLTITISTVLFGLSLLTVYIFLWMRQSIFYANPVLAKVLNKAVTVLSWSTLAAMLISGVCLTVLYCLPQVTGYVFRVSEQGCTEISDIDTFEIVPTITLVTTIYFQLTLLGLFLYPLLSRKTQRYRSAANKNNTTSGDNSYSQHHSSVSNNTDDNLSDGDVTASHSNPSSAARTKIENPRNQSDRKTVGEPESDIESGVDLRGPSDKSSESNSSGGGNENHVDWKGSITTHRESGVQVNESAKITPLGEMKRKRSSIFSGAKLFKSHSFFYRRHQSKMAEVPLSPTAKRSRAKTVATVSLKLEREETKKRRKSSNESSKNDSKKKSRRRKRTQQGRRMMQYLKKVFYLMMICVITDIIPTVLQDVIAVPELTYITVFDLNLMVNIICILLSFRDWHVILFPSCSKAPRKDSFGDSSFKASMKISRNGTERREGILRRVAAMNADSLENASDITSPKTTQYHRQKFPESPGSFSTSNNDFNSNSGVVEKNMKNDGQVPKQET